MVAKNLLLEKPDYKITDTGSGVWREYLYQSGALFREYTSHAEMFGMPVVSLVSGVSPETGKRGVARGVVAIGARASGFLAIGQFASGYVTVAQFGTARLIGVGQFIAAPLALGQFAIAVAAIAQFAAAGTGIFMAGVTAFGGLGMQVANLGDALMNLFR